MADRTKRLTDLKTAVLELAAKEKKRIEDEVAVLKKVMSGRTAGKGLESSTTDRVAAVAVNDLDAYIRGD